MRKLVVSLAVALMFLGYASTAWAQEQEKPWSIRPFFTWTPFVTGDVVKSKAFSASAGGTIDGITFSAAATLDVKATSYDDAFKDALGGGLEVGYRPTDIIGLHAGFFYREAESDRFDGATLDAAVTLTFPDGSTISTSAADTILAEFEDESSFGLYAGVKLFLPENVTGKDLDLYARGDLGFVRREDIDVKLAFRSDPGAAEKVEAFDSDTAFMGGVGVGAEYRFGDFGIFGEWRIEWVEKRDVASDLEGIVSTESKVSYPFFIGFTYHFAL